MFTYFNINACAIMWKYPKYNIKQISRYD